VVQQGGRLTIGPPVRTPQWLNGGLQNIGIVTALAWMIRAEFLVFFCGVSISPSPTSSREFVSARLSVVSP